MNSTANCNLETGIGLATHDNVIVCFDELIGSGASSIICELSDFIKITCYKLLYVKNVYPFRY
jgi:hypothetical protein